MYHFLSVILISMCVPIKMLRQYRYLKQTSLFIVRCLITFLYYHLLLPPDGKHILRSFSIYTGSFNAWLMTEFPYDYRYLLLYGQSIIHSQPQIKADSLSGHYSMCSCGPNVASYGRPAKTLMRLGRCFPQLFSHITTVSDCDTELNAHLYSAAPLKYHAPDTWHDTTPRYIILILDRPVLALSRKSECQARSS